MVGPSLFWPHSGFKRAVSLYPTYRLAGRTLRTNQLLFQSLFSLRLRFSCTVLGSCSATEPHSKSLILLYRFYIILQSNRVFKMTFPYILSIAFCLTLPLFLLSPSPSSLCLCTSVHTEFHLSMSSSRCSITFSTLLSGRPPLYTLTPT